MSEVQAGTIEQMLQQEASRLVFLTEGERSGGWRACFGEAAPRVPQPYWLYSDADQNPVFLGFPLRSSPQWEALLRDLGRLIDAEIAYRRALAQKQEVSKSTLVEIRRLMVGRISEILENAYQHDYGQRLPEVFLLVLTRETAVRLQAATRGLAVTAPQLKSQALDEIRYATAQRVADVTHRARTQALDRLRQTEALQPTPASRAFCDLLRDDVIAFAEIRLGPDFRELTSMLQGHYKLDASRFKSMFRTTTEQLRALRAQDPAFDSVLRTVDVDGSRLADDRVLYSKAVLDLLEVWSHPATPRMSADLRRLLADLAGRCKRFEVVCALRDRVVPVSERGFTTVAQVQGRPLQLSGTTRPFDFTSPGILPSVVRRYGLLYDMVEFTQLLEELRRRGRGTEEQAMRQMVRFLARVDEIRERHRLKFEKFLGDGSFYSARSARSVFLAAAELRLLYEGMRREGFAFERGLRIAANVGTYHLLPMVAAAVNRPQFEFFGHGLVELARLTTGKTTHEVEDIADFLIASGYDLHRVLEFLEPVRHATRFADILKDRPYAAFIAENGELVNLGSVVTEGFLRDLEAEWGGWPMAEGEAFGTHWLLLATAPADEPAPWIGLRSLGTARLKGLEPTPLAEVVVFEQLPPEIVLLPQGSPLQRTLQRLSGEERETMETEPLAAAEVDPRLCVVSVLEDEATRTWYIGRYEEEVAALLNAFRVKLSPVGLKDGEPFEAWLFQRRSDLSKLYQGLRRSSSGATVPLEDLRRRDGYFTCLLATPHRSPR
ncbi:MAG TPA: hypothetical protein VMT19_12485 [Thermoanaerobaculaceae bacterium]|nr:hypothetical protein [Thermoanaerobaculaceae bacterium]